MVKRIERALPLLDLVMEVRPRFPHPTPLEFEAEAVSQLFSKALFGLVVTVNELFVVLVSTPEGGDGDVDSKLELVGRLVEVGVDDGGEEEDELTVPDHYRGVVEVETRVFLKVDDVAASQLSLSNVVSKAAAPPPKDIVDVTTGDDE